MENSDNAQMRQMMGAMSAGGMMADG